MESNKTDIGKIQKKIELKEKEERDLAEKQIAVKIKYNEKKWGRNEKKFLVVSDIN